MIKSKKLVHGLLVGLLSALVAAGLWSAGWLDRWEYTTWAWRVRFFARPGPTTDKIKVILLDQASLDWGKEQNGWSWPWPREVYGPIIDFCTRGGAKVVAFDVLYTEPSVYGVSDDEALGAAIKRAPAFVGAVFLSDKTGEFTSWPAEYPRRDRLIAGLTPWLAENRSRRVNFDKATFPIPEVATNVSILGNVADQPDVDGIFRRSSLFGVFDGQVLPSLGLAAFLTAEEKSGAHLNLRLEDRLLHVMNRRVPVDSSGRAVLHFYGRSGTHQAFSAAGVIESELMLREGQPAKIDPSILKDCYVFFGFSAPGLLDLRPTPISRVYPGVEIHATMLDNLLSLLFLKEVPAHAAILFTLILALLSGMLVVFSRKAWQQLKLLAFREWPADVLGADDPQFGPMLFYGENLRVLPLLVPETDAPAVVRTVATVAQGLRNRDTALVVLLVPEKEQIHLPTLPPEHRQALARGPELLADIAAGLSAEGVPVVNLMPVFQEATAAGQRLYWRDDTHWNDAGIQLAAEELWRVVEPLLK